MSAQAHEDEALQVGVDPLRHSCEPSLICSQLGHFKLLLLPRREHSAEVQPAAKAPTSIRTSPSTVTPAKVEAARWLLSRQNEAKLALAKLPSIP